MPTMRGGSSSSEGGGRATPCKSGRAPELCAAPPSLPDRRVAIVVGMDGRRGLRDIESRADCERLVRAFYGRALEDPIIGVIFVDVAKLHPEAHLPPIAAFWGAILLGGHASRGGAGPPPPPP